MEKPDGSASLNNRSLALKKAFGRSKSEWELSFNGLFPFVFYKVTDREKLAIEELLEGMAEGFVCGCI